MLSTKQTDNPSFISYISLPKDEFDWSTFTGNGNIKEGWFFNSWLLLRLRFYAPGFSAGACVGVPMKTYPDKKLEVDSGACYFQGVFLMIQNMDVH